MKEGWVAMDKNGKWWWFPLKPYPYMTSYEWLFRSSDEDKEAIFISGVVDIASVNDWTESLIKVGGK